MYALPRAAPAVNPSVKMAVKMAVKMGVGFWSRIKTQQPHQSGKPMDDERA